MNPNNFTDTREAYNKIIDFLESNFTDVLILKGYAGTGKTTLVKSIVNYFIKELEFAKDELEDNYVPSLEDFVTLMAPTGNAAQILACKTGREVRTIHSTVYNWDTQRMLEDNSLQYEEENNYNEEQKIFFKVKDNPFKKQKVQELLEELDIYPLYIIDESSMISDKYIDNQNLRFGSGRLLHDILKYVGLIGEKKVRAKIIFVGDPAQLPPVDGSRFAPALNEKYLKKEYNLNVKSAELTIIKRQAEGSKILQEAEKIRKPLHSLNFYKFRIDSDGKEIINLQANKERRKKVIDNYERQSGSKIIITYTNKERQNYNAEVRKRLLNFDKEKLQDYHNHATPGDQLVVTKNNYTYQLLNGDFLEVVGEIYIEHDSTFLATTNEAYLKRPIPNFYKNKYLLWKKIKVKLINTCAQKENNEVESSAYKEVLILLNSLLNTGTTNNNYPYINDNLLQTWLWQDFLERRKYEIECFLKGSQKIKQILTTYHNNKNFYDLLNTFEQINDKNDKVFFITGINKLKKTPYYKRVFNNYLETECFWTGTRKITLEEVIDKINTNEQHNTISSLEMLHKALFNIYIEILQNDPLYNCLIVNYGYAVTCHKAQGNEWDTVFIDWYNRWRPKDVKIGNIFKGDFFRWAYTAMTRARKKIYNINPPQFNYTRETSLVNDFLTSYNRNYNSNYVLYNLNNNRNVKKAVVGYCLHKLLINNGQINRQLIEKDTKILAKQIPYFYSSYKWTDEEFALFAEFMLEKLQEEWGSIKDIFSTKSANISKFLAGSEEDETVKELRKKGLYIERVEKEGLIKTILGYSLGETNNPEYKKITANLISKYARALTNIGDINKIKDVINDMETIYAAYQIENYFMKQKEFIFFTYYLTKAYLILGKNDNAYETIISTFKKYEKEIYDNSDFAILWNLLQEIYEEYALKKMKNANKIVSKEVRQKNTLKRLAIWEKAVELNKNKSLKYEIDLINFIMYNFLLRENVNTEEEFTRQLIIIAKRNCEKAKTKIESIIKNNSLQLPWRHKSFHKKLTSSFLLHLNKLTNNLPAQLFNGTTREDFFYNYIKPVGKLSEF